MTKFTSSSRRAPSGLIAEVDNLLARFERYRTDNNESGPAHAKNATKGGTKIEQNVRP